MPSTIVKTDMSLASKKKTMAHAPANLSSCSGHKMSWYSSAIAPSPHSLPLPLQAALPIPITTHHRAISKIEHKAVKVCCHAQAAQVQSQPAARVRLQKQVLHTLLNFDRRVQVARLLKHVQDSYASKVQRILRLR